MATTSQRLERLTNLVAILLERRTPLTLEELVEVVPGYPSGHEAARRQFERDKDTLRGLGVPIELERLDPLGSEVGYRIPADEYYLEELDLTDAERAALHVAVTAVHLEGGAGTEALWKLGGREGDPARRLAALPFVPALPDLFDAYRTRATVAFGYRGERRRLDPYGLLFRNGRWYVVGHDHDRGSARAFRVDRVEAPVEVGEAGSFAPPPESDPAAMLRDEPWQFGEDESVVARIVADPVVAADLARNLGSEPVERHPDGSATFAVAVSDRAAFRSFVLGYLDRVEVLEPPPLRDEIVDWLRSMARPESHG